MGWLSHTTRIPSIRQERTLPVRRLDCLDRGAVKAGQGIVRQQVGGRALRQQASIFQKGRAVRIAQRLVWIVRGEKDAEPSGGKETSYKTERGVAKQDGTLTAGFDGSHGWFWPNRGAQNVTIKLRVEGAYSELKKM